jgi:hypothetical protein
MTTMLILIGALGALFCGGAAAFRAGFDDAPATEPAEHPATLRSLHAI